MHESSAFMDTVQSSMKAARPNDFREGRLTPGATAGQHARSQSRVRSTPDHNTSEVSHAPV